LDALCFFPEKNADAHGAMAPRAFEYGVIKEQGGAEPVRISALDAEISIARRRAIALF
jgi:hypothetical protein